MIDMIQEDVGLLDLTTLGLEIGAKEAKITFLTKEPIIVCGVEEYKVIYHAKPADIKVMIEPL